MNKLKRVLTGTLALAMAASMFAACGDKDDASSNGGSGSGSSDNSGKIAIEVYTFTEETESMINIFLADEANKDIADKYTFNYHLNATASEYIQLVASDIQAGKVDLFVADADYAKQFAEYENTATLADLGITVNASDYYEYTLNFTKNSAGEYTALSHQAAPGVVLYRRDFAEEVLGSDDPETVQEALKDWDAFKATADKMKEAGHPMVSGIDELKRCFMNNRDGAWIKDGAYYCDEATVKEYLELTKYLADNGETQYVEKTQWTDNWTAGMSAEDGPFCYFGCTWFLHYTIKPGSLANADDGEVVGNGTYGKWGIVAGPAAYFWGGTWWYGSKQAAADADKAAAVKAVIEYFTVDDDSMKAYMEKTGDFPSKPGVADQLSTENDFLGGQDHFAIFREAAPKVNVDTCTKYDDAFNTAVDNATTAYVIEGASIDDAINGIKTETESVLSDLS